MRGAVDVIQCRVHIHNLKVISTLCGNPKYKKISGENILKKGVFLWQICYSLLCFFQAFACHTSAHCHGHSHRTNTYQSHTHSHPVVSRAMQQQMLTLAISRVDIFSYPARTSILTPTFIMTEGSICPQANTKWFRSPKMVGEVTSCLHHPSLSQHTREAAAEPPRPLGKWNPWVSF